MGATLYFAEHLDFTTTKNTICFSDIDEDEYLKQRAMAPEYHVSSSGDHGGLSFFVLMDMDNYISYTDSFYGVSVMLHSTDDFPSTINRVGYGQPGGDLIMSVQPTMVVSEPRVRSLSFAQRQCYFEDEFPLVTSPVYTYTSCMAECTVDTIYEICGCLPFYYPEVRE